MARGRGEADARPVNSVHRVHRVHTVHTVHRGNRVGRRWMSVVAGVGILVAGGIAPAIARGDLFRYKDGRVIAGSVRGEGQESVDGVATTAWAVEVAPGVLVQVLQSELAPNGREPLSAVRQNYADNVGEMEQTAERHMAVAAECIKLGMTDLARAHYLRVLDLDPDNSMARLESGYAQDVNGRWVKKEEIMGGRRGKVYYKGRWRFPESIAIEDEREEAKERKFEATRDLLRWNNIAQSRDSRAAEALKSMLGVTDPLATETVVGFLENDRRPAPPKLKLVYVELLSRFGNVPSARALARASMEDPSDQVRKASFDAVARFGRGVAIPYYVGYLGGENNAAINLAGEWLGQLNATEAIPQLIDALVTTHSMEVGSDAMTASPTSGSFSVGNSKTVIKRDLRNMSVLTALRGITGQAFEFDQARWRAWYANAMAPPAGDLRRE